MIITNDTFEICNNQSLTVEAKKARIRQLLINHELALPAENTDDPIKVKCFDKIVHHSSLEYHIGQYGDLLVNQPALGYGWMTVLMSAAKTDQPEIIQWLIETQGAKVNVANEHGMTALLIAAQNGHTNVVRRLLSLGADIDKQTTLRDTDRFTGRVTPSGTTPIHGAINFGHVNAARALKVGGANLEIENVMGLNAMQYAESLKATLQNNGETIERGQMRFVSQESLKPSIENVETIIEILEVPSIVLAMSQLITAGENTTSLQENKKIKNKFKDFVTGLKDAMTPASKESQLSDDIYSVILANSFFKRGVNTTEKKAIQNEIYANLSQTDEKSELRGPSLI